MRFLLLLVLLLTGCGGGHSATAPATKGLTVNDGDGDYPSPMIRWGTPRDHGFGTKAWDVPFSVSGLPLVEADRAAANVIITTRGAEITSGWCTEWGGYSCFGLPTAGVPQVSMSWLGSWWGPVEFHDGEMGVVVVNPTGGEATVTLGASGFFWRPPGEASYHEVPMTISGPRTLTLSR